MDGAPLRLPVRPLEARAHGLSAVHQYLGLIDDRTVLENPRVGRFRAGPLSRRVCRRHEREEARAAHARGEPDDAAPGAVGNEAVTKMPRVQRRTHLAAVGDGHYAGPTRSTSSTTTSSGFERTDRARR